MEVPLRQKKGNGKGHEIGYCFSKKHSLGLVGLSCQLLALALARQSVALVLNSEKSLFLAKDIKE